MITLLTLLALPLAVWAADRLFLNGELAAMVREEARVVLARRGRAAGARRGIGAR